MLGRKKKVLRDLHVAWDLLAAVLLLSATLSFLRDHADLLERGLQRLTGYPFRIDSLWQVRELRWLFSLMPLSLVVGLRVSRYHEADVHQKLSRVIWLAAKGVLIALGLTIGFLYFFSIPHINRSLVFGFYGLFGCYLGAKEVFRRSPAGRLLGQRTAVQALWVGRVETWARRRADLARLAPALQVQGLILSGGAEERLAAEDRPFFRGSTADLRGVIAKGGYDCLLLDLLPEASLDGAEVLRTAEEGGLEVWHFAELKGERGFRPAVDEFAGRPLIVYQPAHGLEWQRLLKRLIDVGGASFLLVTLSPLLLGIAIAIRLDSPGPVLYRQLRTGLRGRPFRMLKFRTMDCDAEDRLGQLKAGNEQIGPVFKLSDDPRVTSVGRRLRRLSLDELPQLWNVVKGEMSLVGPRPLPLYETEAIAEFRDRRRYSVPPGVTGLWQISGRNDLRDFAEWVRLDLHYIDSWNLRLDLMILLRTIPVVLTGSGAR